jgi:hypothetical protein
MGSNDAFLKVSTTVELSQLKAGMQEAAALVQKNTKKMEEAFAEASKASQVMLTEKPVIVYSEAMKRATKATQEVTVASKEAQKAQPFNKVSGYEIQEYTTLLKKLGLTEQEIAEQMQIYSKMSLSNREQEIAACEYMIRKEKERTVVATQQISTTTNLFGGMTKASTESTFSFYKMGKSISEAIYPLRLLAFILPGIGIAGMISLFGELLLKIIPIPDAIKKIFESEEDVRKKAVEVRQETEKMLNVWDQHAQKLESIGRRTSNVGLAGTAKSSAELKQLAYDIELAKNEYSSFAAYYNRLSARAEKYFMRDGIREFTKDAKEAQIILGQVDQATKDALLSDMSKSDQERILTGLTDVAEKTNEAERKLAELRAEYALKQREVKFEGIKDTEEVMQSNIEISRKTGLLEVEQRKLTAEQGYRFGKLSLDQYTAALIAAENERYAIEVLALEKRENLLQSQAGRGINVTPKLQEIGNEKSSAGTDHKNKLNELELSNAERHRTELESVTRAANEAEYRLALEKMAQEEQLIRSQYELREITSQQEENLLQAAAQKKYQIEVAYISKLLELERKQPQLQLDRILNLHSQLKSAELKYQNEVFVIKRDANTRDLMEARSNAQYTASIEIAAAERALRNESNLSSRRLSMGRISASEWHADKLKHLDAWLAQVNRAIDKELLLYKQGSKEYAEILRRKQEFEDRYNEQKDAIEQERSLKRQQALKKWTDAFTNQTMAVLKGQQSFGQAMGNIWNEMASNLIQNSMKMLQQMVMNLVTGKALDKEGIAADAGSAAAATYKTVAKIPYVGPFLAPPAAAAAFAAVLAFGSFDRGGVVNEDMVANVHKREMVLDPYLSTGLQNLIRNGAPNGAGANVTINQGGTIIGERRFIKKVLKEQNKTLVDMVKGAAKQNAFSNAF